MSNLYFGIVDNAQPAILQADAEIRFFIIGWRIGFVEAIQFLEVTASEEQEGTGTVINIALEHERVLLRILPPSVAETGAIRPDNTSGFLQAAIE